ncbi:MAG TPA: ABC transporter permease [Thermoanaerobaculia bacterium]|nr:ABC transporter permease [Thermoanaerobaculia bacterium]
MGSLLQDLRFAVRSLAKHPGFAAVIVLTLALGIGADTAIFSIVNASLLRPLPYGEPDRLVQVEARRGADALGVSWLDYLDWKARSRSFEDLAYFQEARIHLGFSEGAEAAGAVMTTGNLFSVLRVQPVLGRGFLPEEMRSGAAKVAVISHDLWTGRFGGDRNVLGQTVRIEGESHAIIGVMQPGFHFPSNADLWVCVEPLEREGQNPRTVRGMEVVGRLKPGVGLEPARAEMRAVAAGLARQYPDSNARVELVPTPLRDRWVGDVRMSLLLLLGACGFLLLIACANVANLLLARAVARQREISVRTALGAGRLRLVRQLLTESLVLAGLGGAAGLAFASWGTQALLRALIASSPAQLPAWIRVETDATVLAFAIGVSLLVGLLFGLAPIVPATRIDLISTLKEGSRGTDGSGSRQVRHLLVVSEVALALLLLLGAGLTMKSLVRLWSVQPGFQSDGVLTVTARFPFYGTEDVKTRAALYRQALERIGSLSGVDAVGANTDLPLTGTEAWHRTDFLLPEQSPDEAQLNPKANLQRVTPGYFRAMGIPLLRGRAFAEATEQEGAPRAILVNRVFAERLWPGKDPIGQRVAIGGDPSRRKEWTVVGVVGDVRHQGLDREGGLDLYVPFFQFPSAEALTFVMRGRGEPSALAAAARSEIRAVSADLLVETAAPLERLVASALWRPRLWGALFGAFSAIALILAAVGIYGVMSFTVGQRTREIGLRMALGAGRAAVARLLLGQGLRLTLAGIGVGLIGAVLLGRFLAGLLYQVEPTDVPTWLGISLLLAAVSLVATWIPTRRALRIDPMVALREE